MAGFFTKLPVTKLWGATKKKLEETPEGEGLHSKSNLTGTQQKYLKDYLHGLRGANEQGFDTLNGLLNYEPEGQAELEAPIMERWEQQLLPSILERFQGMGNNKASSGLNQTLSQGARGVSQDVAQLRAQLMQHATGVRQNALQSLTGMTSQGLNPSYNQSYYQQGQQNWLQQVLPLIAQFGGKAISGGMGGV